MRKSSVIAHYKPKKKKPKLLKSFALPQAWVGKVCDHTCRPLYMPY